MLLRYVSDGSTRALLVCWAAAAAGSRSSFSAVPLELAELGDSMPKDDAPLEGGSMLKDDDPLVGLFVLFTAAASTAARRRSSR
jgi:hypothetical protein